MKSKTIVIACDSLREYVEAAQKRAHTDYPVLFMDKKYHRDPAEMREHLIKTLRDLPESVETVLAAMGFCGGSWDGVETPCRLVLPRIDDCVSLLLQTGDRPVSDLKSAKHLYVRARDPADESFKSIFEKLTADKDEETKRRYHEDWKSYYDCISIMDTGLNDCLRPGYLEAVKRDADWLDAGVEFVKGGTYLIEKLLRGEWDKQFLVLEPGSRVKKSEMLI